MDLLISSAARDTFEENQNRFRARGMRPYARRREPTPCECGTPSSMKQKPNGRWRATRTPKNERLRQRSRGFVEAGLLRPGEAAKLAGVSIALMHA